MTRGMRVISNHSSAFCLKHLMAIHSHTFTAVEILWTVPSPLWHLIHLGLADRWYQLFATAPPQPFNTFMHFQSISTLVAFANKAHIQSIAAKSKFLSTPLKKNIETYRKVTSYYNGGTSRLYNSLSFWQPAPKNIVDLDHSCDHLQKDQTQGVS